MINGQEEQHLVPVGMDVLGVSSLPVLSVHELTKHFSNIIANDAISLNFYGGEIHVLLGENGAGKSTLIGMIAGMLSPDSGDICLDEEIVHIRSPRQAIDFGIGTVFQHRLLVPSLSVIENLMLGEAYWQKLPRGKALQHFDTLSSLLGITLHADTQVASLSLGEQQQVEIMRALWRHARVLILDEPTSMLTPQGIKYLSDLLHRLKEQGVAIVLVTHKLDEAYALGDRISVLRRGRVVGAISPNERSSMNEMQITQRIVTLMFGGSDTKSQTSLEGYHRSLIDRRGKPRLQIEHVTTAAQHGICSLKDMSFQLWPGEVLGIAGVDGNGQKPLAQMLAGQLIPTKGALLLEGKDITRDGVASRRHAGMRYLTDDRLGEGGVSALSMAFNLLLKDIGSKPFWRKGLVDRSCIEQNADNTIRAYDIQPQSPTIPLGKLSGGNIQKVLLARELNDEVRAGIGNSDIKVVILNKPTHGLDLQSTRFIHDLIRKNAAMGRGIILLSNDLEELLNLSDRIMVLVHGRAAGIVDHGPNAGEMIARLMIGAAA